MERQYYGIVTNSSFLNQRSAELDYKSVSGSLVPDSLSQSVALTMQDLIPDYSPIEKYRPLTEVIGKVFKSLGENERYDLRVKLGGHVGVYDDGKPWMDLEAAWLLSLHQDVFKPSTQKILPKLPALQYGIKTFISEGHYVPLQHLLHALNLAQFNPQIEEYPMTFNQVVPINFIEKINRSDVLRAINIQALFLGVNFPIIGIKFASILEHFWNFMFVKKYSALAGMELYNEFFFDFSCQLGNGIIASLDNIPSTIEDKVTAKYNPK